MGKHLQPRRARLLPVLGIIALVAALLAVARFAMADDRMTVTDATVTPVTKWPQTLRSIFASTWFSVTGHLSGQG